jgi:ankyrin repeat protein
MMAQGSAIRRSMIPASWLFATFAAVLTAVPMVSAQATLPGSNDSQATATQALVEAARRGDLPAIASLIEAGANVNGTASGDNTPLIAAAREGHTSVVELLLDRGASINYLAEGKGTALILASAAGRLDTVKLLVARSADLNVRTRDSVVVQGEQVVYDSLGTRRVVPVRRLEVQVRSALAAARRGGHNDVAALLVSVGAQE